MGLDDLLAALGAPSPKGLTDHPDWPAFAERKIPAYISFYYTNQQGQEAYWDMARVIRVDLRHLQLIIEGSHGDPLRFDIPRMAHCKNSQTGEKIQPLLFDLIRMWQDIYDPPTPAESASSDPQD